MGWSRNIFTLILFWSLWVLIFSCRIIISPLLPVIEDELTISHALAGGLFFFLSLGYATAVLLSGLLSVRIGHKRTIALGFAAAGYWPILPFASSCSRITTRSPLSNSPWARSRPLWPNPQMT